MFPDLELAVEDGEPSLAHDFFNTGTSPLPPTHQPTHLLSLSHIYKKDLATSLQPPTHLCTTAPHSNRLTHLHPTHPPTHLPSQIVKRWVGDLRHTVAEAQHRNQESMFKLHNILLRDASPTSSPAPSPLLGEEEGGGLGGVGEEMMGVGGMATYQGGPRIEALSSRSSVSEMDVGGGGGGGGGGGSGGRRRFRGCGVGMIGNGSLP